MGNEASNEKCSESESSKYAGSGYLVSLPTPSLIDPDCESTASTASIDMHPPSPLTPKDYEHAFNISSIQMSDCWSCYHPQKFGLNPYAEIQNTIHRISKKCKSSNKNQIDWISVFGTQIIQNGHYKAWKLKIYPRHETVEYMAQNNMSQRPVADIVVGVVDVETIKNGKNTKYNRYDGGFWKDSYFGYGYYGFNGKKFHKKRRGKVYGKKYRIGDIITIELDRQCNELSFYVNDVPNGLAFRIDEERNFVLAVSFCCDNYDVQICDM